jgi:hypothetical protein
VGGGKLPPERLDALQLRRTLQDSYTQKGPWVNLTAYAFPVKKP